MPTSLSSAVPWPSASVETGPARDITVERLSPALAAWLRDSPLPEGARQEASRMPPQVPEDPAVSQGRAGARAQPRADGVVDEPDASARARMLGHPRGGAGSALEAVRAATRAAAQPPPDYRQEPMPSTPSSDARAATPQPVARPPAPGRPVRSTRSDGGPVVTTLLTRMSVGRSGLRGLR